MLPRADASVGVAARTASLDPPPMLPWAARLLKSRAARWTDSLLVKPIRFPCARSALEAERFTTLSESLRGSSQRWRRVRSSCWFLPRVCRLVALK